MKATFSGKKISGILSVLPEGEYFFDDEVNNYSFPANQTMRLKKIMGFNKHRLVKETTTASDLCVFGLNHLLEQGYLKKEDIGAIVTVSLCPDYFVPHIGNIIEKKCGLSHDIVSFDLAQGCCGFLLGLYQSFSILDHLEDGKKVVLFNVDILSHKVSRKDRNDFPLIGDAAAITILENDVNASNSYWVGYNEGDLGAALQIMAGAFAMPSSAETAIMQPTEDGNYRSLDNMKMEGTSVFQYVQQFVPPLLEKTFEFSKTSIENIQYFFFHQPNKFMLKKLADKVGIPYEKIPMNVVENFGNPSGSSIPLAICFNNAEDLKNKTMKVCFSAFGSGLARMAMILDAGKFDFCETVISNL